MHTIEINGRKIEYRDVPDLNRKLADRDEQLAKDEAARKMALLNTRQERRAIAKLLGVNRPQKAGRMAVEAA